MEQNGKIHTILVLLPRDASAERGDATGSRPTTQATAHSLRTQALAATRPLAGQRQSAVGLHLRNPSLMDYYSFNRPRRDGRLSRPCWLTDSGRFTHKVVTRPAVSLAQG